MCAVFTLFPSCSPTSPSSQIHSLSRRDNKYICTYMNKYIKTTCQVHLVLLILYIFLGFTSLYWITSLGLLLGKTSSLSFLAVMIGLLGFSHGMLAGILFSHITEISWVQLSSHIWKA